VDPVLILLRIVHIGSAMIWFGGAVIGAFYLAPIGKALGQSAQPFFDAMERRGMGILFPVAATLTVLSGLGLYWRDSSGLQLAWITSPSGLAFTAGGLAAVASLVGGFVLIGPSIAEQTAVKNELALVGGGAPDEHQQARLDRADRRMHLSTRIDFPLIVFAALTMAVGRYL
jgi:hypothetical protein